ncbi:valine--tRNA ligase [bacterium]
MEINSQYNPKDTEQKWYEFWLKNRINHSEPDENKNPFTIVIPPPNITGALHMGHALNNILQDIFIRSKKMAGFNTCWIPGTDHGGIATQNVVEKMLLKKGTDRHKLGREKFLEIMWDWRNKTGDTILMQLRKLGCLCDWDRTRFTMDDVCANAVFEAFKTLYDKDLIYRGTYMVNWCPRCHTALSDIEVEYKEQAGKLWHIMYPFKDDPKNGIIVATTRPETMLGDTAVAVNPQDKRYKKLVGKTLILPIANREIPIIADNMVEKEFGTGAVKITPSHDPNDYETAKRHNLPHIIVIDKQGKMTVEAGIYEGLDRYECRKKLTAELESLGVLKKVEDYKNNVASCYRCSTAIEPLVSDQWYLKTREMADKGIKAVKDKKVTFTPENWEKPYLAWMENLYDWCISRQIWWGHRIPVWYCKMCYNEAKQDKKGIVISMTKPGECPFCGSTDLVQDEDVLDTWFSSSLWPFSTLEWPKDNNDLNYYYPTSVLATGHEILYLWVARMIMMGITLKGDIPFEKVYIHGIVRDHYGKKMSKSLGNVIDPLEIISEYGTDALRYCMTANGIMGRDLHLAKETFTAGRNFCNKLWNASRLVLTNLNKYKQETGFTPASEIKEEYLELSDKWILSITQDLIKNVTKSYEDYDFADSARTMHEFTWNTYCDWYLEIVKSRLYSEDKSAKETAYNILIYVLKIILKLLHPVIPFITEEIWQNTALICGYEHHSILEEKWPEYTDKLINNSALKSMAAVIDIVSAVRNIQGEMRIPPSKKIELLINLPKDKVIDEVSKSYILYLLKALKLEQKEKLSKPEKSAAAVVDKFEIYIPLENLIDIDKEKERLKKEVNNAEQEIERLNKKLANKNFLERAPKQEIEKAKTKHDMAESRLEKLKQNLNDIS